MPLIDDPGTVLAVLGILALAGLVHGALGFGFPLLATPLLAALFDVRTAIVLTLLPTVAVNLASLAGERAQFVALRPQLSLIGYAALASLLGSVLLLATNPEPFRLLLAGMILLHLWQSRGGVQGPVWETQRPGFARLLYGLGAGFAAGTVNVMVPVLIIYATRLGLGIGASVVLFNACFLAGKSAQIAVFGFSPQVGWVMLALTLGLAVPAVGALLLGRSLRTRIDPDRYRRVLRWMLAAVAGLLVLQFLT